MPSTKLICPHCGHDGTPETSLPPLGSYGFNYLAEEIVFREVRGCDDAGRLMLSGSFKREGPQGTGVRIVCRSCGQAFPLPNGLTSAVVPDEATPEPKLLATAPEPLQPSAGGTEGAAEAIARSLVAILHAVRQELEGVSAGHFAKLEDTRAAMSRTVEKIHSLSADLAGLRAEAIEQGRKAGALGDQIGELRQQMEQREAAAAGRVDALASALEAEREASGQLATLVAELQGAQDASRDRMDAQAGVLRALHAATQEQITRREEIKAAVQRLEQIAGGLGPVKPLPEEL